MGRDSHSKGCGFKSRHHILDGHFFTFICCKNCNVCLKRPKINKKEAGVGPFFLKKKLRASTIVVIFYHLVFLVFIRLAREMEIILQSKWIKNWPQKKDLAPISWLLSMADYFYVGGRHMLLFNVMNSFWPFLQVRTESDKSMLHIQILSCFRVFSTIGRGIGKYSRWNLGKHHSLPYLAANLLNVLQL